MSHRNVEGVLVLSDQLFDIEGIQSLTIESVPVLNKKGDFAKFVKVARMAYQLHQVQPLQPTTKDFNIPLSEVKRLISVLKNQYGRGIKIKKTTYPTKKYVKKDSALPEGERRFKMVKGIKWEYQVTLPPGKPVLPDEEITQMKSELASQSSLSVS